MADEFNINAYLLRRYHSRMSSFREILGGKCVRCGSIEDLEIDHVDPATKSFDIAAKWNTNIDVIYKELEKCQLLCKDHHRDKTGRNECGSYRKSRSNICNCSKCENERQKQKEYHTAYMKEWRRKRKI